MVGEKKARGIEEEKIYIYPSLLRGQKLKECNVAAGVQNAIGRLAW